MTKDYSQRQYVALPVESEKKLGCSRWFLYGVFALVALLVLVLTLNSDRSVDQNSPTARNSAARTRAVSGNVDTPPTIAPTAIVLFTRANWGELNADPEAYKGAQVDIAGRVFAGVDRTNDVTAWQMFADPRNSQWNILVVINDSNFQIENGDFVRVVGTVQREYEGKNLLGGTVTAPLIIADKATVVDALAVASSPIKVVNTNQSISQNELVVTLEKVEFASDETRVFIKVTNNTSDEAYFQSHRSRAVQNTTQYEAELFNDYTDVQNDLLPGIESSGIIVFPPMDPETSAKFYFEGRTDDYSTEFEPYVFETDIK